MSQRFTERAVLITGAGSGLGRATALRLAEEGASLSLADVAEEGLAETEAMIHETFSGVDVLAMRADVASEADVDALVKATLARFGGLHGFFNNAGVEGRQNQTEDYGADEFDRVISINLRGVFLGMQAVLPVMRAAGAGSVVNTASVGGIRGVGRQSGYAASKHGVVGLTRNSAIEYAAHGVRINAIAPGSIWTPMVEGALRQLDADDPRGAAAGLMAMNPTGRFGEAHEVAGVVAFLLSDDASYINAAVIPIDGGQSAAY